MNRPKNQLHHLKVASPCSADWDSMAGTDRVRFCGQCELHVYNISDMTREEAIALVTRTEGRLCARFFRRSDGTILTRDCPTGFRAVRARASRVAGAILTAILSLVSSSAAGATSLNHLQDSERRQIVIKRVINPDAEDAFASLAGTIYDTQQAVITTADITLINERTGKKHRTISDSEGVFHLESLEAGDYTLMVEAPGFVVFKTYLALNSKESVQVSVRLDVAEMGEIVLPAT
jgi:Carboxypeptidase regulatory-like domain